MGTGTVPCLTRRFERLTKEALSMTRHFMLPVLILLAGSLRFVPAADIPKEKAALSPFFQPPRRPVVPQIKNNDWVVNPIDAFILAQLESKGLSPNARADKLRLLRRVTFDLTGLPPTLDEQEAFLTRRLAGRLSEGSRAFAGVAALRRTLGAALARSGALRRDRWLQGRRAAARSVIGTAIMSSGASTPICPTIASSGSNSPATNWSRTISMRLDRHRLHPALAR